MHFHNSSPQPLCSEDDSGPFVLSEAARSPSARSRPLDGNDQGVLSPQMTHVGSLGSQNGWNNIPYCEDGAIFTPTGPLLDLSFDHGGAAPATQMTTVHREYPDPFLTGSFHDIPDITWDQTTPDTAYPATPPSPCYRNLKTDYVQEGGNFFDPCESRRPYCPQKPVSKLYQPLAMSEQHKLRSQQIKRARQDSPKLGLEYAEHYGFLPQPGRALPNKRKREHSPSTTFTSIGCFDEDHGTPETQLEAPDGDNITGSEPYAQLIYRALKSVPNHSMVLKDIYEWFAHNTDKPQTSTSAKGWQNSIRHNLSMNGVRRSAASTFIQD